MSILIERLVGSILGLLLTAVISCPYYMICKRYFEEYVLPVSLGLSISTSIVIAYILQFFSALSLFPLTVLLTYIAAYYFGSFGLSNEKALISLFGIGFLVKWIPNFFTYRVPNYLVSSGYDSQHHLYLTKLISEAGTIPETWQTIYNVPIFYNPGFALLAASLNQFPLTQPMDVFFSLPFILSTTFGLLLYTITREIGFERKYSLFSAVAVLIGSYSTYAFHGFGGKAQLAAMVAMASSLFFFLNYRKTRRKISLFALTISMAAMGLSHYYVAIYLGIFYGFYFLKEHSFQTLIDIAIPGAFSVALASPWLIHVITVLPNSTSSSLLSLQSLTPTFNPIYIIFLSLGPFSALIALFYRKNAELNVYAAWAATVLALSQTAALGFYILIGSRWWYGAILPMGVLAASGAKQIYEKHLEDYVSFHTLMTLFLIVNLAGVSFIYTYRYSTNLRTVTTQDYQTFEYIENNVSEQALIHRQHPPGGWVLPITGRNLTTPFIPVPPENFSRKSQNYQQLYENRNWDKLEQKGVDYYFIGKLYPVPEDCERVYKSLYRCG